MEKPSTQVANLLPPNPSSPSSSSSSNGQQQPQQEMRRNPPSPEELVAHYVTQGVDPKEAPLKVIEDLQAVVIRAISSAGRGGSKDKFMSSTTRKLDNINTRLAVLDMKLDSKPGGYPQAVAIGVSAGATVSILPHLAGAIAQMWDAVRSVGRRV